MTPTNTAAQYNIQIGDYLVAGHVGDTDCDAGAIVAISDDGESADVAWWIGACRTTVRLADHDDDVDVYESSAAARTDLASRRENVERNRG